MHLTRSQDKNRLALSPAVPQIWNHIPTVIRVSTSLNSLKHHLKTHYFALPYTITLSPSRNYPTPLIKLFLTLVRYQIFNITLHCFFATAEQAKNYEQLTKDMRLTISSAGTIMWPLVACDTTPAR